MTPRTITRICPNISYLNGVPNGVSESLKKSPDPAAWFRAEYDKDQRDFGPFDIWEIAPLGRYNDSAGQWRWPSRAEFDGPIMHGFNQFLDGASHGVRASFGCPRRHLLYSDRRDFKRLPLCMWQFDDVSERAPQVAKWLLKCGVPDPVLETVLTDNPAQPRLATRFVTFPGMEHVVQRVRASIVQAWVDRGYALQAEFGGVSTVDPSPLMIWGGLGVTTGRSVGARLSLYLPAKDCETMTAATLARVLPLFVDVSLQGVIPAEHMSVVREWRDAVPVKNTDNEGGAR